MTRLKINEKMKKRTSSLNFLYLLESVLICGPVALTLKTLKTSFSFQNRNRNLVPYSRTPSSEMNEE